jgi:hypothetical protein
MKSISPQEASLLALLGEQPKSRSGMRLRIMKKLRGEAHDIAVAMRSNDHTVSKGAAATARGVNKWVKTNKTSSSPGRTLSVAVRRRIPAAQRKRWAAGKQAKATT